MKKILFSLLLWWAFLPVFAQNEKPIFWVLYGQYPIGTTFKQQDWIISKDNITPIVLISLIDGFVVLRERGKWQAQQLFDKLKEQKNSPFPELYIGEPNPKRNELMRFGNVERCPPPLITTCLPIHNKEVLSRQITIRWRKQPNQEPYRVVMKNTFDEIVSEKTTQDTLMNIDFASVVKDSSNFIIVEISQCDTVSNNTNRGCGCSLMYSFELMEAQKKEIKELAYQKNLQTTPKNSPALANLHDGLWFYKNASLIEAFIFFQKAHAILPNSKALYFVLGQILAENSYHYTTEKVYPHWRLVL